MASPLRAPSKMYAGMSLMPPNTWDGFPVNIPAPIICPEVASPFNAATGEPATPKSSDNDNPKCESSDSATLPRDGGTRVGGVMVGVTLAETLVLVSSAKKLPAL